MSECYLVFQSITAAQQARSILNHHGLYAGIVRASKAMSSSGCAHALYMPEDQAGDACALLVQYGIVWQRQFRKLPSGLLTEVQYDVF